MKHYAKIAGRLVPAAICAAPVIAFTEPADDFDMTIPPPPATPWEFRLESYGWLTGLDGTTQAGGITTDVDAGFSDVAQQLKMAAALQFEARYNKRWGITVDGFYAALGDSGATPGPLYNSVSVNLKQFIGQATVSYRFYDTPNGFIDAFAGARYNGMWLDLGASIDTTGVQTVSTNLSSRITTAVRTEAQAIIDPRIAEYKAAAKADRATIETELKNDIQADANARAKEKIEREFLEIRRKNSLAPRSPVLNRLVRATVKETAKLAEATAQLKVAELRASVDSKLQGAVNKARKQVAKADKALANAIDNSLQGSLPTKASANEQWVDPIIGFRGQYNFNDHWYLAGTADVGGFGIGSDLTWSLEAAVGYNFSNKVSAELGYKYLYTDYSNGGFSYDMAQAGIYTGLNIKF